MKLVLAEKPSVAQSIAKVLGATKREDGYLEGNGYVVSWCVGHLVELSQPEAYDEKYNKWAYADLPIFPDQWKYQVSASTKKQFGILKKLMARKDVESLVCATDAGREGELIFRLVYQQAGCRKPFERLWISSMEDSAIREGFEQLKPSTEYDALYEAALCRERADWLVGINATRLFSTLYGQTLNVGRVMTPTLAMVVMREAAISAFRPEPFYTVELAFQDFTASGERMKQKVLADDVARKCVGSVLNVTKAENKEKSEKPPALYDLTSLQRDANRVLGFTAQQTLDYTQSLYEKKLVTYPRTDSRYLTSDMKDMLPELIKSLFNIFPVEDVKNVPVHAAQVINDKKVSDHHAIIPTKEAIKCSLDDLPKGEQAILRLIATRLFCAVGEPFRYNESVIELSDGNYIFSAKGKTTVQSGWKIFSGKPADKDKEGEKQLPSLTVGEGLSVYSTEVKEGKTSPPKHFTEDTLLQSMETAGADEMPEDAERKGLGTPATRAATIEKLVRIGFLERKGDKKTKHEKFHLRKVLFLFGRSFLHRPVKFGTGDKFRETNHGGPDKGLLVGKIHTLCPGLMPQSLQWWNDIFKIAVYLMAALIAHFNGKRNAVQQFQRCLVFPCRVIGVALALHRHKIHRRDGDDLRFLRREVKFFIFLLIVKWHPSFLLPTAHAVSFC